MRAVQVAGSCLYCLPDRTKALLVHHSDGTAGPACHCIEEEEQELLLGWLVSDARWLLAKCWRSRVISIFRTRIRSLWLIVAS